MEKAEVSLSDIGAFVPFPAALLDEQMPRLKDTEWRLLCVIVRQTLGWQSGKGRKKRDWMTQKQLMKRTGRNSAALSGALDTLVKRNLVACQDENGELLLTPQQRRRHRGRIYFSLTQHLLADTRATRTKKLKPEPVRREDPRCNISNLRTKTGWTKASDVASRPSLGSQMP